METPPEEKKLQTTPFVAHATRGVIRDPRMRRRMMAALVGIATLMAVAGSTVLRDWLNPREHFGWFVIFWLSCAWFTVTAILLALFDLLLGRAERRAAERTLREQIVKSQARGREDE